MDGYKRFSGPSLSGLSKVRADTVKVSEDLVVDTSTLTTDHTNNRVGICTSTPAYPLDVVGNVNTSTGYWINGAQVLSSTALGSGVTGSSLTSVGTLTSLKLSGSLTGTTFYGDNFDATGVVSGPTGSFTSLKATTASTTNSYSTNFTGTNVYASNLEASDLVSGPTGSFTSLKATTTSATNSYSTNFTGTNVHSTTLSASDVVSGGTGSFGVLSLYSSTNTANTATISIDSSKVLTLGGTNVYLPSQENDLICTITPRTTGTNLATLGEINSTGVYGYQFVNNALKEVSFMVQLSHQWAEGTSVTPHVHWCPSSTNTANVVFGLDYWVANISETIPSANTVTKTATPNGTAYKHQLTAFDAVSMSGKTASCIFGGRLYRDGGSGDDAFTGTCYILGVDLHVSTNRWGATV